MIDWNKSRVLVTGGAGFFGSYVVDALVRRGASQIDVPRRDTHDLVIRSACRRVIENSEPHVVFHLAAEVGGIGANLENPGSMVFENAMMGLQLLEECRRLGVPKVVIAGSVCAYPKLTPVPFREADLWNGYPEETNAPYGIAKKLLLVQSQAYRQQYGFNSCMLFPANMYGPRDNFDLHTSHVIPAMIRKFVTARDLNHSTVELWGDGTPTREFIHAADAAEAFVLAAELYDSSDPMNIGTGEEISIAALARLIAAAVGYRGEIRWDKSKPNGQPRRRLDVRRAQQLLGFQARIPLGTGIEQTIEWYEKAMATG